jgi:hypothetical protein
MEKDKKSTSDAVVELDPTVVEALCLPQAPGESRNKAN